MRIVNRSGRSLTYATEGSVGLDLHACIDAAQSLNPGWPCRFSTGISVELPYGTGAMVLPRSGLSMNHGVIASTGVIDFDYRGEIAVMLYNLGSHSYTVKPGDRIAQLVLFPAMRVCVEEVEALTETARGAKGFGSSGR
jgi:dUTP pyrophosphatase